MDIYHFVSIIEAKTASYSKPYFSNHLFHLRSKWRVPEPFRLCFRPNNVTFVAGHCHAIGLLAFYILSDVWFYPL